MMGNFARFLMSQPRHCEHPYFNWNSLVENKCLSKNRKSFGREAMGMIYFRCVMRTLIYGITQPMCILRDAILKSG